jgi:hypothetical protein
VLIGAVEQMMSKSFSDLFEDSNRALLAFLKTELNLGFTFAGMAKEYREKANNERFEINKRNAIEALAAIEQFKNRLSDNARCEIERDRFRLETFISTL